VRRLPPMVFPARTRRTFALVAALATTAAVFAADPVLASSPPSSEPTGTENVQLILAPRDQAGLQALAKVASELNAGTRVARRAAVLPDAARVHEVVERATDLGFDVTTANTVEVDLTGSAALVRRYFGSARAVNPSSPTAQALPALPPSLRGLVTVAGGGDDTRPAMLPRNSGPGGTLSQADLRSLYGVPNTGSAVPTASSPAVATIQFSSWNPANLTQFVRENNLYDGASYDPVARGGYVGVQVGSTPPDATSQLEVALDQDAITTLAPSLRQVVYFVAQSTGFAAAVDQVAQDAASRKIVALSDSWGQCELDRYGGNANLLTADQNAVLSAAAAGVTVFAASGDNGTEDCTDRSSTAVDVPAAIPGVTGVGGTSVDTASTTTSWDDQAGSSGGGYSAYFCATSTQAAVEPADSDSENSDCAFGSRRGVPDIALAADPEFGGLEIYSAEAGCVPCAVGGTSLATPLAAAGFAAAIVHAGALSGIGDINPVLDGAVGTSAFTDIVEQEPGATGAANPPTPGWDPVTGLGSPHWSALVNQLIGRTNSLYTIDTTATPSGRVEIGELTQSSGYQTSRLQIATALATGASGQWQYFIGPFHGDGRHDLYAVCTTGCSSHKVEVHVLSEASNYQTFILHAATALAEVPAGHWQFTFGSFAGDHASDLFGIDYAGTASKKVEVHALSASSNFHTWIEHAATALAQTTPGKWQFVVGDSTGSGNLVGVLRSGSGGHLEVHILTRASGYHAFSLHRSTGLVGAAVTAAQASLTPYDADANPDLVITLPANTTGGKVDIQVFTGASAFSTSGGAHATSMNTVNPNSWDFQLAH
jgi:hypothetical protein